MSIEIRRLEGEPRIVVQQSLKSWKVFAYVGEQCVLTGEGYSEAHAVRIARQFEKDLEKRVS